MSKLLQVTSALALIFISSETFASNIDELELGLYRQGLTSTQVGFVIQNRTNIDQQELELYRQGLNRSQVDYIIDTFSQNSATTPVSTSSVVSVTPTPVIEEAVRDVFINMATLSIPGTTDHNIFEEIYLDVHRRIHARTGAGSKDYSIIEWINKIKGARLYNPDCWGEFQKKAYAHDQCDINMVSSGEQLSNIQAIFYKAFYEKSQKKITELHEVGSRDSRSIQEIIDSMSRARRATIDQQVVNNVMHVKKNIFGF